MTGHLLGGAGFSTEAELGSTLAVRAMGLSGGQIFDPEGRVALGLRGTGDVLLDQIGFYEVVGCGETRRIAVNFDNRESNPLAVDAAGIDRWQRLGTTPDQAATVAGSAAGEPRPVPIGLWILAVLAAIIVMESWAGNWHLRVRRGLAA